MDGWYKEMKWLADGWFDVLAFSIFVFFFASARDTFLW
jgi:hypothetical protein